MGLDWLGVGAGRACSQDYSAAQTREFVSHQSPAIPLSRDPRGGHEMSAGSIVASQEAKATSSTSRRSSHESQGLSAALTREFIDVSPSSSFEIEQDDQRERTRWEDPPVVSGVDLHRMEEELFMAFMSGLGSGHICVAPPPEPAKRHPQQGSGSAQRRRCGRL